MSDERGAPGRAEQLELRAGPTGSDGVIEAWRGDRRIAVFAEQPTESRSRVALLARESPIDPTEVRALLDALLARAARQPGAALELATSDPLFREIARRLGFHGPLRDPLVAGPPGTTTLQDVMSGPTGHDEIRAALEQLLPGISVVLGENRGPLRAIVRRAVSGISKTFDFNVEPAPGMAPTRFSVPNRSDLLIESIARCIDTTVAVRRRFGRATRLVRRVSFDHSDFQLLHGQHAGSADRSAGVIHFNASFASVAGLTALEAAREQRSSGAGSAGVPAPFNQIDGTMAHEAWHQIQAALEARRSMDGVELRRRLGEGLGVETLEQAVNGGRARAPESWKRAHTRLVEEVSAYAATAPVEATAEMFKLWWCSTGSPAPIVAQFGGVIRELLADFKD